MSTRVRSSSPHLGNRSIRRRSLREDRTERRRLARKRDQWIHDRMPALRRTVAAQMLATRVARAEEARQRKAEATA